MHNKNLMAETRVLLKTVSEFEVALLGGPNQWLVNGWLVNFLLSQKIRQYWWPPVVASYVEVLQ